MKRKILAFAFAGALCAGGIAVVSAAIAAVGPGGNGPSPNSSQATRCMFNAPLNYGFASKQACLAFFDAGGRMWDYVDDFSYVSNPALDRWGFQTWSYKSAAYGSPNTGSLLTNRSSLEGGNRLQWDTIDPVNFNVPLVGVYSSQRFGIMHPGRYLVSPQLAVVEWKAWSAGSYEVRYDLWLADGTAAPDSPDIGWSIYRDGTGGLQQLAAGTITRTASQRAIGTLNILSIYPDDRLYLVIDPGTNSGIADGSNADTTGFRLTVLRPGQ